MKDLLSEQMLYNIGISPQGSHGSELPSQVLHSYFICLNLTLTSKCFHYRHGLRHEEVRTGSQVDLQEEGPMDSRASQSIPSNLGVLPHHQLHGVLEVKETHLTYYHHAFSHPYASSSSSRRLAHHTFDHSCTSSSLSRRPTHHASSCTCAFSSSSKRLARCASGRSYTSLSSSRR